LRGKIRLLGWTIFLWELEHLGSEDDGHWLSYGKQDACRSTSACIVE